MQLQNAAAAWIDEGEALTFSDATFSQINLDAHKLHVAVKVTEELLYDNAFQLENYIIKEFYKAWPMPKKMPLLMVMVQENH